MHWVLGAASLVVVGGEVLDLAVAADVHLVVLAQGQVLGQVLLPAVLVACPCGLSQYAGLVGLGHLGVVDESE